MHKFKSHFWYTKNQRNGIVFLVLIIIVFQLVYFFVDFSPNDKTDINSEEIVKFQQEIDSLKNIELAKKTPKIFPFNPSFMTDFKGYQLGMSIDEIDRLLAHRAAGNYINSAKEFQQVTQISDSLLAAISPYFKFPDWVLEKQQAGIAFQSNRAAFSGTHLKETKTTSVQDLNTASIEDLTDISGIGPTLAKRIINYRDKLNGFLINEQLYEVYYLDTTVANRVLKKFAVLKQPTIEKVNINEASFKQVLSIVYLDYDLTKKIFQYRDEIAEIQSLEELKKIEGFPLEKFDRIALYLTVK